MKYIGIVMIALALALVSPVVSGAAPEENEFLREELKGMPALIEAEAGPRAEDASWQGVTETVQDLIDTLGLDGAVLRIASEGEIRYERAFGEYTFDTVISVASATKWVSGALVMSVAEDGLLELDAPLSTYFEGVGGPAAQITIDQMLSHTSGMPGISDNPIDLQQPTDIPMSSAARQIARIELEGAPGKRFAYSGAGFQMAGAIVERVTGHSWESEFQRRLAGPLGMDSSYYGHPLARHQHIRGMSNPNVQAGLHTSANDYWKFLEMIYAHGRAGDTVLLTPDSVRSMEMSRLAGVEIVHRPASADEDYEYGFGMWCEDIAPDGTCTVVSSSGAWGTYPWIDRTNGIVGLLLVYDRMPNVRPWTRQLRALSTEILAEGQ